MLPKIDQKITIFCIQIGGWAFIRAWAFNRDFMVYSRLLTRLWTHHIQERQKLAQREVSEGTKY